MISPDSTENWFVGKSPTIVAEGLETDQDPTKVLQSINEIIGSQSLIFLSTVRDTTPYGCICVFAYDRNLCTIYFSDRGTEHSQNVLKNNKIAGEIADTHQTWESPRRGIQFMGTVRQAEPEELHKVINLYMARFPGFSRAKIEPETNKAIPVKVHPYIIRPTNLKIFDEKIFRKETWINVSLPNACELSDEI